MATADAGQQRTKGVNFRVTPQEKERIDAFIGSRNASDVLRRIVLRAARDGDDGE